MKLVFDGEDYRLVDEKGQMREETPNPFDDDISKRHWEGLIAKWRRAIRDCAEAIRASERPLQKHHHDPSDDHKEQLRGDTSRSK